jgi:HEXXH motif-containing protein
MAPRTTDTLAPPRDLTIPEGASHTARDVLSASMRRLLVDLRRLAADLPAHGADRADAAAFARLVEQLYRGAPGAVASALRRPNVCALVRCARNALGGDGDPSRAPALLRELRGTFVAEVAAAGALPAPLRLAALPPRVVALGARTALALPPGAAGNFANGALHLDGGREARLDAAAPANDIVSHPYHDIEGGIVLAEVDNNPLSMFEAHPDKSGNAIDLGGRTAAQWCAVLRRCLDLIARHMPLLRSEIDLFVHQVVPVGYHDQRHLSASYQEAVGTIYMTLHPNLMTMTEALVHEFSHNKLNALFELDPVLENAFAPLYASPVRPDPRPLHGVVLAVHAFQPIARLYERMTEAEEPASKSPDFQRRFAQIRKVNRDGAAVVLGNGRPTAIGRGLLDEMRRWDEHYAEPSAPEGL